MNLLIGIILVLSGALMALFIRNSLIKLINIRNKIRKAEKIIAENERKRKFKENQEKLKIE